MTYVENAGEATVKVPCGIIQGESDSLIIIGAHHDTVYMAQGAIDDSSGTATDLEMARQFGLKAKWENQNIPFTSALGEEKKKDCLDLQHG